MNVCKRCNANGPVIFGLINGATTTSREAAYKIGWKWTSVSCSYCGDAYYKPIKPRVAL